MALDCTLVDIDSMFHTSVQGTYFYQVIFGKKIKFSENQNTLRFHYPYWYQGIMPQMVSSEDCAKNCFKKLMDFRNFSFFFKVYFLPANTQEVLERGWPHCTGCRPWYWYPNFQNAVPALHLENFRKKSWNSSSENWQTHFKNLVKWCWANSGSWHFHKIFEFEGA